MATRVQVSPFIRDMLLTTATSLSTGVSLAIATRLLVHGLGPEGFGVYAVARRTFGTLVPFTTLAMGVAVARFAAMAGARADSRVRLLVAGVILGVAPSAALAIVASAFADALGFAIFHTPGHSDVVMAAMFMLVGYSVYNVVYAFYRGTEQMRKANLWHFALDSCGSLTVAALLARKGGVHWIFLGIGSLYWTTVVPLGVELARGPRGRVAMRGLRSCLRELVGYGVPRVPGSVALAGILATGPLLVPYFGSVREAGSLVAVQSVFAFAEIATAGIGVLTLPRATSWVADGQIRFLRARIHDLTAVALHLGLFLSVQLFLWADQVIVLWLGPEYIEAIGLMRVLAAGLVPYLVYVMCRSTIDAVDKRAANTRNLYAALATTVGMSVTLGWLGTGTLGLAGAVVAGFGVLGVTTLRYLWRHGWLAGGGFHVWTCVVLNAAALLVGWATKGYLMGSGVGVGGIAVALSVSTVVFAAYYAVLRRSGTRWIRELERRLVSRA